MSKFSKYVSIRIIIFLTEKKCVTSTCLEQNQLYQPVTSPEATTRVYNILSLFSTTIGPTCSDHGLTRYRRNALKTRSTKLYVSSTIYVQIKFRYYIHIYNIQKIESTTAAFLYVYLFLVPKLDIAKYLSAVVSPNFL